VETKNARDKIWKIKKSKYAKALSAEIVNRHASNR